MFPCQRCGMCCRNLQLSPLYRALDRGDGTCKYLNGNLCGRYDDRPLFCRIDDCYTLFFKDVMSIEQYYKLNLEMCKKLQRKENHKEDY